MNVTPEIIFHDVDRSAWVEHYVSERLQRLERHASRIVSCHVTLTQEQASHHKGNLYSAMVEVRLPPNWDVAAKKEREIQDMQTELPALINSAFQAVEKQVRKAKDASR
jgi:ribosomal subunit interface protein